MCRDIRNWNGNSFSVVVGEGEKKFFFYFSFRSSFQEELQTPVEFGENSETSKSKLGKRKKTSLAGIEFDAPRCFHFPLRVFSFVRSTWWTIEREKRRGGGRPAVVEIFFICCVCVHLRNGIFQLQRKRKPTVNRLKQVLLLFCLKAFHARRIAL